MDGKASVADVLVQTPFLSLSNAEIRICDGRLVADEAPVNVARDRIEVVMELTANLKESGLKRGESGYGAD